MTCITNVGYGLPRTPSSIQARSDRRLLILESRRLTICLHNPLVPPGVMLAKHHYRDSLHPMLRRLGRSEIAHANYGLHFIVV